MCFVTQCCRYINMYAHLMFLFVGKITPKAILLT